MFRKTFLGALLILSVVAGMGSGEWPKMKLAKRELQKSQSYLYAHNAKEGPAWNATRMVSAAIVEADESIKLDSHNHHVQLQSTPVLPAAVPSKEDLRDALEHLLLAKEYLEAARPDQGGHREKALNYTNGAIRELEPISPPPRP
jgi:hypothetical protein